DAIPRGNTARGRPTLMRRGLYARGFRSQARAAQPPTSIEMPLLRVAHIDAAGREVLFPARRDRCGRLLVAEQLLRVPRLDAGVDDDRAVVGDVVPHDAFVRG